MSVLNDWELYTKLAGAYAAPGMESDVAKIVEDQLSPIAEIERDGLGNLIARIGQAENPCVMLFAHMDEVAMVVAGIQTNGNIRVLSQGLFCYQYTNNVPVAIKTTKGNLSGILQYPKDYQVSDPFEETDLRTAFIETEFNTDKEVIEFGVCPGDRVFFMGEPRKEGEYVAGKSADDRVGVFAVITAARKLASEISSGKLNINLCIVGTVMEEGASIYVAWSGAHLVTQLLKPDMAIGIDTDAAACEKNKPSWNAVSDLGMPSLDGGLGIIRGAQELNYDLVELSIKAAKLTGVRSQVYAKATTFADYTEIAPSGKGTLCAALTIPIWCGHSHREVFCWQTALDASSVAVKIIQLWANRNI